MVTRATCRGAGVAGETLPGVSPGVPLSRKQLSSFGADDASAGYAMGIAIVLFILFGLGMAAVTLLFVGMDAGPADQF